MDFAHRDPGRMGPQTSPNLHNSKEIPKQKLLVKRRIFQGYVGEILEKKVKRMEVFFLLLVMTPFFGRIQHMDICRKSSIHGCRY